MTHPPRSAPPQAARLKIIVFSVIQRKVIKPSDTGDAAALTARLLAFQDRYNKFTRAGLHDLCRHIDARRSHRTALAA